MDAFLAWLTGLPTLALYAALMAAAAVESFFPFLPADTVVAFGSVLAARGEASAIGTFVSTWTGSVGGAMIVYGMGRRMGAKVLQERLDRFGGESAKQRLEGQYAKRGAAALFLSRFLPGVRALVPPFAGAAKMPAGKVALIIGSASAIWYGIITVVAFQLAHDWDALQSAIRGLGRGSAILAGAIILVGAAVWFVRRRSRAQ